MTIFEARGTFLDYTKHVLSSGSELYGVIGDPIAHSLSPVIQNTAFQLAGISAVYVPFCVKKFDLKSAVVGMRVLGVRGFNVTAPHKVEICRYLDGMDSSALEIGSVNTVVNKHGSLYGYNTDGTGGLRTLVEAGAPLNNGSILLLGAGGSSRALAYVFASRAKKIQLVNRTLSKAKQIQRRLEKFNIEVRVTGLSSELLRGLVEEADIIVNASSMGQSGHVDPPIQQSWLRRGQFVFDIVYDPVKTGLLRMAQAAGATTIDGLRMLVNQGACSFEIWTGRKAPVAAMHDAIRQKTQV